MCLFDSHLYSGRPPPAVLPFFYVNMYVLCVEIFRLLSLVHHVESLGSATPKSPMTLALEIVASIPMDI